MGQAKKFGQFWGTGISRPEISFLIALWFLVRWFLVLSFIELSLYLSKIRSILSHTFPCHNIVLIKWSARSPNILQFALSIETTKPCPSISRHDNFPFRLTHTVHTILSNSLFYSTALSHDFNKSLISGNGRDIGIISLHRLLLKSTW